MNIYAHPYLATLWVILILAELRLAFACLGRERWMVLYACGLVWRGSWLVIFSAWREPYAYYLCYWIGQYIFHAFIFAYALHYAFLCLRWRPRLPQNFAAQAFLVAGTLVATVMLLRLWQSVTPDEQVVLFVDQWATLFLCGVLWMVTLACSNLGGRQHGVMLGFVGVYSLALVTACLRVYLPMTRVECWAIDLTAQLVAVMWWVRSVREYSSPRMPLYP